MAKEAKIVLVDMDGVIVNLEEGLIKVMRREYPDILIPPPQDRTSFYFRNNFNIIYHNTIRDIETRPGFFRTLPPIPEAKEALLEMGSRGHDVIICSSPLLHNPTCASDKYNWLEENIGPGWDKKLIIAKDKTLIMGDILIDDRPEIRGNYVPVWEYVLFDHPYNRNFPGRRLNWKNWKEVLTEL